MTNLDPAEEWGARDLLVVKEDLYLVCDGLFRCEGDQALPAAKNLINKINIWSRFNFYRSLTGLKEGVYYKNAFNNAWYNISSLIRYQTTNMKYR
jgi:hypothetical protein